MTGYQYQIKESSIRMQKFDCRNAINSKLCIASQEFPGISLPLQGGVAWRRTTALRFKNLKSRISIKFIEYLRCIAW